MRISVVAMKSPIILIECFIKIIIKLLISKLKQQKRGNKKNLKLKVYFATD